VQVPEEEWAGAVPKKDWKTIHHADTNELPKEWNNDTVFLNPKPYPSKAPKARRVSIGAAQAILFLCKAGTPELASSAWHTAALCPQTLIKHGKSQNVFWVMASTTYAAMVWRATLLPCSAAVEAEVKERSAAACKALEQAADFEQLSDTEGEEQGQMATYGLSLDEPWSWLTVTEIKDYGAFPTAWSVSTHDPSTLGFLTLRIKGPAVPAIVPAMCRSSAGRLLVTQRAKMCNHYGVGSDNMTLDQREKALLEQVLRPFGDTVASKYQKQLAARQLAEAKAREKRAKAKAESGTDDGIWPDQDEEDLDEESGEPGLSDEEDLPPELAELTEAAVAEIPTDNFTEPERRQLLGPGAIKKRAKRIAKAYIDKFLGKDAKRRKTSDAVGSDTDGTKPGDTAGSSEDVATLMEDEERSNLRWVRIYVPPDASLCLVAAGSGRKHPHWIARQAGLEDAFEKEVRQKSRKQTFKSENLQHAAFQVCLTWLWTKRALLDPRCCQPPCVVEALRHCENCANGRPCSAMSLLAEGQATQLVSVQPPKAIAKRGRAAGPGPGPASCPKKSRFRCRLRLKL
jgi:hypothetical protein